MVSRLGGIVSNRLSMRLGWAKRSQRDARYSIQ